MNAGARQRRRRSYVVPAAVGIVAGIVVLAVVYVAVPQILSSHFSPPPSYSVANGTLGPASTSRVDLGRFLGLDFRADESISPAVQNGINTTGVRLLRFPGGNLGERYDPLGADGQGLIFSDAGNSTVAQTSLADFAHYCKSVSCHAIITLPAEIDNASMAAAIVSYSVTALGFQPEYWEIGNEPADWIHWGYIWTQWNLSQNVSPSPQQFALEVQHYVSAIRSVDPGASILGLGGEGAGSVAEAAWISAVVAVNGPNLSGLAIHVYPDHSAPITQNLTAWFETLQTAYNSLPTRVPADVGAIRSACPACNLSLIADEYGTAPPPTQPTLSGGFRETYTAAELIQGFGQPIGGMYYWGLQNAAYDAWVGTNGSEHPPLYLYQALYSYFGPFAGPSPVASTAGNLYAAVGGPNATAVTSLLFANANTTYGVRVNISETFPTTAGLTVWVYNGTANVPSTASVGGKAVVDWIIPPASVAIFRTTGLGVSVAIQPTKGITPQSGPSLLHWTPPGHASSGAVAPVARRDGSSHTFSNLPAMVPASLSYHWAGPFPLPKESSSDRVLR